MENYTWPSGEKAINEPLHSIQLDENLLNMVVKTGSKVLNLTNFACVKFEKDDLKQMTWNGSGDALNKVVACAEIIKKRFKNLYQINKIGFENTEELWKSKAEDLRDIKVTKQVPCMCIILSKTPLDPNETGYQTEKTIEDLFNKKASISSKKTNEGGFKGNAYKNKNSNLDNDSAIYVKKQKTRKPNEKK